jgi:ABC-type uncharacterized transport system substrate-binding protein
MMISRWFLWACLAALPLLGHAQQPAPAAAPFKILHVMSYHSPWRWTDGQLDGFKQALAGVPIEVRVFQLDTKKHSTPEAKERIGREARALVDSWKPDLLYTSDDDAQELVAAHYLNTKMPMVFSGVNADPSVYGYDKASNVTGVLEQEHFAESVKLLRSIVPTAKRIAVVMDDARMWLPVAARMRKDAAAQSDFEVVAWETVLTWEDYQAKVKAYHGKADAIALIGIFNFKDRQGKNVPYQEVLKWTAANSTLPDLSFWIDRVAYGTLAAVTVSEREQGIAAGRLARAILVDKQPPSALPMRPTLKGLPVVSLARANALGLKIRSSVLLSAEVVPAYDWAKDPR